MIFGTAKNVTVKKVVVVGDPSQPISPAIHVMKADNVTIGPIVYTNTENA